MVKNEEITKIDIINFIRNGNNLLKISIGNSRQVIIEKLGPPERIVGDDETNWLHYKNGIRFRTDRDVISELGIDFWGDRKAKYVIKPIDTIEYINSNSKLHNVIK